MTAYSPRYASQKAIEKALTEVRLSEGKLRDKLHHVLCSAIAHHEACLPSGSINTVLSTVMFGNPLNNFKGIDSMKSIDLDAIVHWLRLILGQSLTRDKAKDGRTIFKGKLTFTPNPKINGIETHYSEIPFWDVPENKNKRDEAWSFISKFETMLAKAERLAKDGKISKDELTFAKAMRDLAGAAKLSTDKAKKIHTYSPQNVALLSKVASAMIDDPARITIQ